MTRASVQSNGHLNIPPEAARQLGLSLDKSLLICPMGEKDLAVTVVEKGDPRGFIIKKTGPYHYVPFRSLMNECGLDCTKEKIVFDIIELNERYEGRPVFKFNRRIITHASDAMPEAEPASETTTTDEAEVAQ